MIASRVGRDATIKSRSQHGELSFFALLLFRFSGSSSPAMNSYIGWNHDSDIKCYYRALVGAVLGISNVRSRSATKLNKIWASSERWKINQSTATAGELTF